MSYTISMSKETKQFIKVLAISILGMVMFAGVGIVLCLDIVDKSTMREKMIYGTVSFLLTSLCFASVILNSCDFYNKRIRPRKADEPKTDYDVKREADVHKKLPGKDMYEVIRLYRKRNYSTRVIVILFCCLLLVGVFLIKMSGEMHIDVRISIAVGVLVIALTFALAGRKEFTYSSELDFRKAVEKNGADPVRINADFMMGSHFSLRDGLTVLGRDYLVIFAKSLCEVLNVEDIARITKDSFTQKVQGTELTVFRLKITLNNGAFLWIGLRDEKETDLMIDEFRKLNILSDKSEEFIKFDSKRKEPEKRSKYE